MTRRELLTRLLTLATWGALPPALLFASRAQAGAKGAPFGKEWLIAEAERIARQPYAVPDEKLPAWIAKLDWDGYQSIRFRADRSLWRQEKLPFQARLFHLGLFFKRPVKMHEVVDGVATPIAYSPDLFDFTGKVRAGSGSVDGFAGFRIHTQADWERDMFAFLGASYFRAVGGSKQYGLSARGLAIDSGMARAEEFPDFRAFWLERPSAASDSVTIHALLDSPSVAGAYTFTVKAGDTTVMDVDTHLFTRQPIERLGIAPLTSMFQHGENDRRMGDDFRPEIHDSDGLALHTGTGEWIWRPVVNSSYVRVNSFLDDNPRGFGLLQRDRNFDHYQDDGTYYDKRPSLWVEPLGGWGKGSVMLVEIPTKDETFDNLVAFWNPADAVQAGQSLQFAYRLHWGGTPLARPAVAEVVATRTGVGGIPGQKQTVASRKFVIDFKGGKLAGLDHGSKVQPVVSASRGEIRAAAARPFKEIDGWRCNFDLVADGTAPVDLRCYLKDAAGDALTETWLYQWSPV